MLQGPAGSGICNCCSLVLLTAWVLGPIICKLVPYVQGVSVCASVYTLVAVAVERYYSVCRPWKRYISTRRCRKIIGCIWIAAALLTSPWILVFQQHTDSADMVVSCTLFSPLFASIDVAGQFSFTRFIYLSFLRRLRCGQSSIMRGSPIGQCSNSPPTSNKENEKKGSHK